MDVAVCGGVVQGCVAVGVGVGEEGGEWDGGEGEEEGEVFGCC